MNMEWTWQALKSSYKVPILDAEMGRRKVSLIIRMYMPVKESGRGMSKRDGACVREGGEFVVPETRQA